MTPYPVGHGSGGWLLFGVLVLVVLAAASVALIISIDRAGSVWRSRPADVDRGDRSTEQTSESPAVRLLEERFARGEIDADEFRSRRELLKTTRRRP